jgi:RNA polymerase sigma factor (sigma-70 family)
MYGSSAHRVEDHVDVLRGGFDGGVAAHGALGLAFGRFAERALALTLRRLERIAGPPSRGDLAAALARAALADVYLAAACEDGVPGAWERFVGAFGPTIARLAVRRGASRAEAEEMAHDLPGEIFAPPPGGGARTRLGTFDGAGSLTGWLAVIVQRRLVDRRRAIARGPSTTDDAPSSDFADAASDDPAARAAGAETARAFALALAEAWNSITPREAVVVLLRYRDGLQQTEIARLLRIGEPRVSRTLSCAAEKIRAVVLRRVGSEPGGGDRDSGHAWAEIERALAEFMATLPRRADPSSES